MRVPGDPLDPWYHKTIFSMFLSSATYSSQLCTSDQRNDQKTYIYTEKHNQIGTCILFHWYLISFKHDLFQFGEPLIVNLGWEKIVGKDVLSEANAPFTTVFLLPKWRVYPPDYLRGYKIGPLFLQVRTILTRLSPYAFWLLYPVLRKEFLHLHLISFL